MKKKALGFIALAMMFMGSVAMAATQDTVGAIRSIDRCNEYGVVQPPGTIETALTVGDKAYFRIRLENHNSQAIWKSWNQTHTNRSNPWYFWDDISGLQIDPVQAGVKVGVFVSGRFTLADVIDVIEDIRAIDPGDGGGPWFTDLLCAYTVQPGDLALPVTLANSNRDEATASDTTAYFLGKGSTLLTAYSTVQLRAQMHDEDGNWDDITDTRVCSCKFGDYNAWYDGSQGTLNESARSFAKTSPGKDYTLFNAGIFIQSIDFDDNKETVDEAIFGTNEVWRAVHERSTSTKEFVPSLFIPGEVAADYAGSVYLWSADANSVMLPDATLSVNGTMVQKLNFDGSAGSLQFRLRGVTQNTKTEIFLSSTLTNVVSGSGRTITNFVSRTVACIAPLAPGVNVLANGAPTLTLNATPDYTNSTPFKVELTQAWTNNEPVTVKFRYYLTNSTVAITSADLSKLALIAISDDQQYGYDSILPDSVTIPAGETDSIELDTNVRALYALGALTGSTKGDKIVIEPYFENADMAAFFSVQKPLALTVYGMKPTILTVNGFAPADIASGVTNSLLSVRGGVTSEFEVRVRDTYRNMQTLDGLNGSFTVTWQYEGGKKTTITNDVNGAALIPDGDGILHVPMMYPVPAADQNMLTQIKVTNADGRSSEVSFYVYVKTPKNVTATLESATVGEGANMPVTFVLSEAAASSSLYAFLEPANTAASNLSYAAFFTTNTVEATARGEGGEGVPFTPGNLVTVSDSLLTGNGLRFFDNSSGLFVYNIRLCTSPTWDPAARTTEFIENQLVVTVTNNVPVITQVMAKNNATGLDKLTTSLITMSLSDPMRTFRVSLLNDVDLDKNGTGAKQVVYGWEAYKYDESINGYPDTPNLVFYTVGLGSELNMETMFGPTLQEEFCGLYKFAVRAQDKDMRGNKPQYLFEEGGVWKYDPWRGLDTGGAVAPVSPEGDALNPGNGWSEAYTFYLRIDRNPYVDTNPFGASGSDTDGTPIFRERDLLDGVPMGFTVGFNDKPNVSGFVGVPVAVTITPVDADGNEVTTYDGVPPYIAPEVKGNKTTFSFTASVWSNKFEFSDFDGTWWGRGLSKKGMRYRLVAAVTSTAASPSGTPWNELYTPATNYFRLENSVPIVTVDPDYEGQDSETNAVLGITYAPNEHFNFRWSVDDIRNSDLERPYTDEQIAALGPTNLIVTCTVVGGYEVGSITNRANGSFSVWFEKPGINKLRISATDKDGDTGYSKVVWFFVETSKNVFLYPYGPSRSSVDSDEIAKYRDQSGFGVGRVWADGGFGSIKAYVHTWTYGTSVRTAWVYGEGYSAWQRDTSTATGKSTAPKQDGSGVGEGDERYVNRSDYDSFFYRWFKNEPGLSGGGGSSGGSAVADWTGGTPSPGKTGDTTLTLPMEETNYTYPDSSALAVFSREKYMADNMGDINGDKIPDVFAVRAWTTDAGDSKRLYEVLGADGSSGSGGDDSSVNDLTDLSDYNDDLDFLPMAASAINPLKPTVFDWGPGVKFDALYEIRGIGMSDATDKEPKHLGLNEPGISDYDLSLAERYALFADYAAAGNVLTGDQDADYSAATNWATAVLWTPEVWEFGDVGSVGRRLNPTKADTDGDGMDDGWEYFFWYYAKVGAVTNGVWGRLEGRRYDLAAPATGTRISPAEIVAYFNPLERNEFGDFDNDGLTDLEEYALGTNPIDWDSDGDGMNDLWEVMNGLDPLALNDDPEILEYDSKADIHNMDRDFMARCTYDDDTFTVYTFANGDMFGLPTETAPTFEIDPVETDTLTNLYKLVTVDGAGATNTYYSMAPVECQLITVDGSGNTNITYFSAPVAYDGTGEMPTLTADVDGYATVVATDGIEYIKSMASVCIASNTAVISASADAVDVKLISSYYGADMVINAALKTVRIWLAATEKPALIYQFGSELLQLAADTEGCMTYSNGKAYLGEARTFPAGTLLKKVDEAPTHMTYANIKLYEEDPNTGKGLSGGFVWRDPETLETNSVCKALPLFNYGGDGVTYVPCSKSVTQFARAPVIEDPTANVLRSPIVKVETKHKVTLIHNQVFNQYGFDPRTAWNIDESGYVDSRWHEVDSDGAGSKGDAGLATRTVPYNSRDEYLVMQYRQQMRAINADGIRSYTTVDGTAGSLLNGGSRYLLAKGAKGISGSVERFRSDTTYPNFPVDFVRELYQSRTEVNPFDNSTNRTVVTYWTWLEQTHHIHGADTDYDGVPDGWELYVNADPNNNDDAKEMDGWANDGDKLNILMEYAGVDSCNAYTNRFGSGDKKIYPEAETITANHPGKNSGWWNKFFPTDPYSMDTDGDGVMDDAEGKGWKGPFYVGRNLYSPQDFSFIYGCKAGEENFEKYAADGKTICFRGGGLNPCTVDTDGDLLPDAWEFQFAGVVFHDGKPDKWSPRDDDLKILTIGDGGHVFGKQNECSTEGYEIRGGMDGTWGNYNDSTADGDASMDFDHDGLANCQEYLVQSLRHLRYDDPYTPLMGIHPGTKQFLKFIPFSAWDGEAFHKRCLAAGFTGLGTWKFSELGYFTLPPFKWDPLYLNTSGQNVCDNYEDSEGAGYRIMLPPVGFTPMGQSRVYYNGGMRYASTDPRRWDTDEDGMDDYYELFHGLNPLLGSAGCPDGRDEYDVPNTRFDVIADLHGGHVTSWRNHWTGWPSDRVQPALDAIRYPWMMGTMECDADGDGLRNDEESIKVNLAKPSATHTDPTPLWMTDSSAQASYTAQYYNPDPYITEVPDYDPLNTYPDIFGFPWHELTWYIATQGLGMSGATRTWMFAFEENEGYDTDHDFKRDAVELSGLPTNGVFKVELPSDPKVFCDPDRRQAIYFPGVNSALATRDGKFTRAVSDEPDLLKQFTVELWVKPEGDVSNVVLVERVCNYGPSTLTYSNAILRANFRLGVDEGGHVYGEYEGSTANSGSARVTANTKLPADTWTHLALTYSGKGDVLSLYMNGEVTPVATRQGTGLIPANGIMGIQQEYYTTVVPYGYLTLPCVTLFGAHARNGAALALDETTQWTDFDTNSFFKGWIDEVRIWDGARTPSEIHANYRKRFSMDDIKQMRSRDDDSGIQGFYEQWFEWTYVQNSNPLVRDTLPAELLQHYNFTTLPGGVGPTNVLTAPVEFKENVLDNVRKPNGKPFATSLLSGWWSKTPVHSTVYWNYAVIPWIGNTVAHLPFLDGSSPDSQYWSEKVAGVINVADQGFVSYEYPNEANPYPYYFYRRDRFNHHLLLEALEGMEHGSATNMVGVTSSSLAYKWRFQLRSDFLGTSDLVPLGGAYARRDTDFWDDQGAMDAWVETSKAGELSDANGNGIPDWAEKLWKKWCEDNGLTVTDLSADDYLRALAKGLLPTSASWDDYDSAFADKVDLKFDGMKDWWQRMYGLTGSAHNDTDKDGLADYVEYLVAEVFDFDGDNNISPLLAKSNGKEFDYFRKAGKLYLGELFTDHDFMEDHFEREWTEIGADPAYYDAHLDADEDGWSNWAEVRTQSDMGMGIAELDTSVTNIFYYTIPRNDYLGYACYNDFKAMADALDQMQSLGELIVEDAQFTVAGFGHTYDQDSVRGLPGCPTGKNGEYHTDRYGTGWFKVRLISKPYGVTWRYRGHPTPNVDMTVHYNGIKNIVGRSLEVKAYTDGDLKQADATFAVVNARQIGVGENRNVNTLSLPVPTSGYLREGKTTFVVTVASSNETESASAASKPEIMGIVRNVDVGWSKVAFDVELLDESPICPRPELVYSAGSEKTEGNSFGNNESATTVSGSSHVYVYRYSVDGHMPPSSLVNRLILDKDLGGRTFLHEGDFLANGVYDIDWTHFTSEVLRDPTVFGNDFPVTSVTYRVYSQPVNISDEALAVSNITPYVEFTREFGASRAKAVPVAPGDYATLLYGARPTFVWSMTGDRPDTYTAFAIQVKDSTGTVVWNSGTRQAPYRNASGHYEWTAPLYVGDQTTSGKEFANDANYTWEVAMFNARYQGASWSDPRAFRMNVYGVDEPNNTDRHSIKVAVKYFGPGTFNTSTSTTAGSIRVEAFTSPDFSGDPAGRTFVRTAASVTDGAYAVNATIVGLDPGTYYVRAYIDSTGDFVRNEWESWGYACPRGDTVAPSAIYAPSAFEVGDGNETPKALVYIEDCDTDQDCLPDIWEYNEAGNAGDFLLELGPKTSKTDGYVFVNSNLAKAISDLINGGAPITLMSVGSTRMPKTLAALMLGTDSVEPSVDEKTLRIKSLALADGNVTISLAAEVEDPTAGTVFVTDGMVRATVVVKYADSLSGEWKSVEKCLEKEIEDGAVSEELTFSLEDLGLDASKGFFKVEVK